MPDIYGNVIRAIYDNWVHSDSGWILAVEDSGRWRRVNRCSDIKFEELYICYMACRLQCRRWMQWIGGREVPYRRTNMMTYGTMWWWRCCVEEVEHGTDGWKLPRRRGQCDPWRYRRYMPVKGSWTWCVLYCNAIGKESVRSTDAFRLRSIVWSSSLLAQAGSCGFASRQDQDPHQEQKGTDQSIRNEFFQLIQL